MNTENLSNQFDDKLSFGTRYLKDESVIFDCNAWDNVEWPEDKKRETLEIIKNQKVAAVVNSEKFENEANEMWNKFYAAHTNRFFMDRNWIVREFPEIFNFLSQSKTVRGLDVGCGVGNTTFPLLDAVNKDNIFMYCCDFSSTAIEIMHNNKNFTANKCCSFVWDITNDLTSVIEPNSLDFILCIYVLSALSPKNHQESLNNLTKLLAPGGILFIKDYARYDLTQLRFKSNRFIQDNFYCRGDGTLVYYFSLDELDSLLVNSGLLKVQNHIDKRLINKKSLLKLCCETAKYRTYLENLLQSDAGFQLLNSQAVLNNRFLALVVLYDVAIGHGISNLINNKALRKAVKNLLNVIKNEIKNLNAKGITPEKMAIKSSVIKIPRYVRVNTLKMQFCDAIKQLEAEGFVVKSLDSNISQEHYQKMLNEMNKNIVFIDPVVENLLIFKQNLDLHNFWMVNEGLVFQDKASCLPSIVLRPEPTNSHVIDVCAAPGMKTTHLAAIMENQGKIFAFDRNKERVITLNNMILKDGVENTIVTLGDFLKVDVTQKKFENVEFALVDPPCSGTGMAKRGAFLDEFETPDENRLRSLANLQAMILKHALRLPKLKRCVYSTCSIYDVENEGVIQEVLFDKYISSNYRLNDDPLPGWTHRGSANYEFGMKCLKASPDEDLTNGFFVALFERKL